ncbi:hypothetical protein G9P44_002871 [Scheffersomyces stipitis]|nr:hypothetical protein G9P44_002871 [Scheffersomyces stipitis]
MAKQKSKMGLDAEAQIIQDKLDKSTFDLIDVDKFYNTKFSTLMAYLYMWYLMVLSWVLLGADIYTCLCILVYHRWSSAEYQPYAYTYAKWIFTGCIIFEVCLLCVRCVWGIRISSTRNIALVYLNPIARQMYSVKSYNYFCLFNQIKTNSFFRWACLYCNQELDNSLQILVADTPRQVINILTLRFYATGGNYKHSNILRNIKTIATTNLTLAVILSFMCLSLIIFVFFFFMYLYGMILFLPVYFKMHSKSGYWSLRRYCCEIVNDSVRLLVVNNHRSKRELLDRGILDQAAIDRNPLLRGDTATLFANKEFSTDIDEDFKYSARSLDRPGAVHKPLAFNTYIPTPPKSGSIDKKSSYAKVQTRSYETLSLEDRPSHSSSSVAHMAKPYSQSRYVPENPFDDPGSFEYAPHKEKFSGALPNVRREMGYGGSSLSYEGYVPDYKAQSDSASNLTGVAEVNPFEDKWQNKEGKLPISDSRTALNEDTDYAQQDYAENLLSQTYPQSGSAESLVGIGAPYPVSAASSSIIDNYDYERDVRDRYGK